MAQQKVNKSEEIRKALQSSPEKGPTEIANELTARGIKVVAAQVSNVRSRLEKGGNGQSGQGRGRKAQNRGQGRGRKAQQGVGNVDSRLSTALSYVNAVGGFQQARQTLDELEAVQVQ